MKAIILFYILCLLASCSGQPRSQVATSAADTLLLRDFRPVSLFRIPATRVEKPRYPVIDAHSHDYAADKDEVARWVEAMDAAGVEVTHIMNCNWIGEPYEKAAAKYEDFPDRFRFWCSFDYTDFEKEDWVARALEKLERYHASGVVGVGEMGDKGEGDLYGSPVAGRGIHIDHPRLKPLLERCAELGMPVNIHVAEPVWMYLPIDARNDGLLNAAAWAIDTTSVAGMLGYEGLMSSFERAVAANPRTTFIACHYLNMNHDLTRLAALLDTYPNLYLDISARVAESAATPRATRRFIIEYADRLLFGTDNGMGAEMYRHVYRILETADEHILSRVPNHYWPLSGFDLPDDVLRKLYRDNALKLFGDR